MLLVLLHVAVLVGVHLAMAPDAAGKPFLHRRSLPESYSSLGVRMTEVVYKAHCEVRLGCATVDT